MPEEIKQARQVLDRSDKLLEKYRKAKNKVSVCWKMLSVEASKLAD